MKTIKFKDFNLQFDESITHETYECPCYHGVIFTMPNGDSYDAINNKHMGERLIIKKLNYFIDMPLKQSSFEHLPEGVSVSSDN